MIYNILTFLVIFAHLLFIIYVLFGAFLGLKWIKSLFIHLPAFFWGSYIELSGGICPLTPLEMWLRKKSGIASYSGDFIIYYLEKIIYPPMLTRELQIFFGVSVIIINLAVYAWLIKKHFNCPSTRK